MQWNIKQVQIPEELDNDWDRLAGCYYLKREFLAHLHVHNYCYQSYYELFEDDAFACGTIVYTVKTNLLTFLNVPTPVHFRVIGLPVSVASPPYTGDIKHIDVLLQHILAREKGLILGINFLTDPLPGKVVPMRTLPTMVLPLKANNMRAYRQSLRHPYRRRLNRITEKFSTVEAVTTSCDAFTPMHYKLYLDVMKTSTTKLETLPENAFRYLPGKFRLTTFYTDSEMLFWHILLPDENVLYYYMCGINYALRDRYETYHNSLFSIITTAMELGYSTVDLGQTAEVAKMRVGALPQERRMFMYHKNPLIHLLLNTFRNFITYSAEQPVATVFKASVYEDIICKT